MKKNKNIEGLLDYSSMRNQETMDKVNQAIDKLKRSKTKKINFQTVAVAAGVSKATLYNNAELKERIMSLRSINKTTPAAARALLADGLEAGRERIRALNDEISRLREDKKKLVIQLVELNTLKDENERLKEIIKKLQDKRTS